jgi:hypothetical protein
MRRKTAPSHDRDGQLILRELRKLRRLLRDEAVVVEARPQVARLLHLHGVLLNVLLGNCARVVGEIPEEMPKILLLAPFNEEAGDIHVGVHAEMPIGDPRVVITGIVQAEERRLDGCQ